MRTIFLDIDGVLNGHQTHANGYCGIRAENVEHLNLILEKVPDAKIVISSAWRYIHGGGDMTIRGFEYLLMSHGVNCKSRIMGFTESDESTLSALEKCAAEPNGTSGEAIRRMQIRRFAEHHSILRFVVLDDLNLEMVRLIQTDGGKGLTEPEANQAIAILTTP